MPYSPLGCGVLTGQYDSPDDLARDDYRPNPPRFQRDNFQNSLGLVREIQAIAGDKGCTPAHLALAWVLAQGDDRVPIPGTKRRKYLEDNVGPLTVELTERDLACSAQSLPAGAAVGERYAPPQMKALNL